MSAAAVTYDFLIARPAPRRKAARRRGSMRRCARPSSARLEARRFLDKQAIAARLGRLALSGRRSHEPAGGRGSRRDHSAERLARGPHPHCRCAREHVPAPGAGGGNRARRGARCAIAELARSIAPATCATRRRPSTADDRNGFHELRSRLPCHAAGPARLQRVRNATETARLGLDRVRRMLNTRRRLDADAGRARSHRRRPSRRATARPRRRP